MTPHEVTALACHRLAYEWELHGSTVNPASTIRRIVDEIAPAKLQLRHDMEAHLHDAWTQLCALEGEDE